MSNLRQAHASAIAAIIEAAGVGATIGELRKQVRAAAPRNIKTPTWRIYQEEASKALKHESQRRADDAERGPSLFNSLQAGEEKTDFFTS